MKIIKRLVSIFLLLGLLLLVYGIWLKVVVEPFMLDQIRTHVEKMSGTEVDFESCQFNWLEAKIIFSKLNFKDAHQQAKTRYCVVRITSVDFFERKVVYEIFLKGVTTHLMKQNLNFRLFPNFFRQRIAPKNPHSLKFDFQLSQIRVRNFEMDFEDQDYSPPLKASFEGERVDLILDSIHQNLFLKVFFNKKNHRLEKGYLEWVSDIGNPSSGFRIRASGNHVDFSLLSVYQYSFTKLKIKKGVGDFYADFENKLGVLNGSFYFRVKDLNFDAFQESIFSSVLGFSNQSFLKLMKQNSDQLELDFFLYGSTEEPTIKLGHFSRGFIFKAPVTALKDSLGLVEKTLNTVLLGIPKKIFKIGKGIITTEESKQDSK